MSLSIGVVGLPNVGKSTLFNALTSQAIAAENYPFCTIDPNVGIVPVADSRLNALAQAAQTGSIVPAVVEFNDIAGLVKGASSGEGLGNEFLKHIALTDAIVHVIRAFEDDNVVHVEHTVDPARDKDIIETELSLKDLEVVEKRQTGIEKEARTDKSKDKFVQHIHQLRETLAKGKPARTLSIDSDDKDMYLMRKQLGLLTDKPVIYIANGHWADDKRTEAEIRTTLSLGNDDQLLMLDIQLEYELSLLSIEDKKVFMQEYGLEYTGLEKLTRAAYDTLGLISFFTAGKKEVRAWSLRKGFYAPQAAGVIHTDFETKFIRAEVCDWSDYVELKGWTGVKAAGKMHLEGKDYLVKEGDVMLFHHAA